MDGVGAVEVHPLVFLGAVNSQAVLLGRVVGLAVHKVGVGEGLAAGVDEGALPVQVVGPQPVGGQAPRHAVS